MGSYHKRDSKYSECERQERSENRVRGTLDVLTLLRAECFEAWQCASVVGRWVWIEFDAKPSESVRRCLYRLGFSWNRNREAWQHPCGLFRARGKGDPRFRYGQTAASAVIDDEPQKVSAVS